MTGVLSLVKHLHVCGLDPAVSVVEVQGVVAIITSPGYHHLAVDSAQGRAPLSLIWQSSHPFPSTTLGLTRLQVLFANRNYKYGEFSDPSVPHVAL